MEEPSRATRSHQIVVGTLVLTIAMSASALPLACPSSIRVSQSIAAVPEGWEPYDNPEAGWRSWSAVSFSEGPPQRRVFLSPIQVTRTSRKRVEIYEFGASFSDPIWLSCLYRDSSIALSRPVEGRPQRCTVRYDPRTEFRTVTTVDCTR